MAVAAEQMNEWMCKWIKKLMNAHSTECRKCKIILVFGIGCYPKTKQGLLRPFNGPLIYSHFSRVAVCQIDCCVSSSSSGLHLRLCHRTQWAAQCRSPEGLFNLKYKEKWRPFILSKITAKRKIKFRKKDEEKYIIFYVVVGDKI